MSQKLAEENQNPFAMTKKELGVFGEKLAQKYLTQNHFKILECNYRFPFGEVDIIAQEEDELVFCEIKTRLKTIDAAPELAVGREKQEKYCKMARLYLAQHPQYESVRFDVIAIVMSGETQGCLRHLRSAFICGEEL
ncbi:MAG: YraN family protein [Coriobacteriia bacterium]|nr:YraN family protein [Coriobacteriia bacterium]